jgi:hypothetical protein
MAAWTVVLSEDFKATIDSKITEFQTRLEQAGSRGEVESAVWQSESFERFASLALDLRDGKSTPASLLSYYRKDEDGTPVYLLMSGRWCGLFSVDDSRHICTGIKIYDASQTSILKRLTGKIQTPFRRHFE